MTRNPENSLVTRATCASTLRLAEALHDLDLIPHDTLAGDSRQSSLFSPGASAPISKSDITGDIVIETGDPPKWWRIDRNKPTITHEIACTSVVDHNAFKLQVTEASAPLGEKAGGRLGVDQFRPKQLNLARENLRGLYSQINRV